MDRSRTRDSAETDRVRADAKPAGRSLVVVAQPGPSSRIRGGRPLAEFLTQLIVSADPALRPARSERTKAAVALYARTAAFERG
ncbi:MULTISPECIES: hypothetical protein [Methylorubrum]|jgi:hypothetical protein|uniref:Uncharacterized protein n=1 Tax=Methylorubrum suomiense TaxID=144191 RepID=A0ABQ4V0N4_9HYPH|nr:MULTISPECIES: hypothetical protein [Methylobacteriaceae]GJE77635.1 hypothetical protein BGCPKDLD_4242 [Methylorubrum suomiense]